METSTLVIGGAIAAVVVVGVVLITREPPTTVHNQQPVQQGNAATSVAQGITQGLLGFLGNAMSSSDRNPGNTPSGSSRVNTERGTGWFQDTANGWLYGLAVRV